MNQILITKKLYITPELKRKKRFYKIEFCLSIFLICLLFSYYIYAEYERDKSEQVSKEILAGLNIEDTTEATGLEDVIIVALDENEANAAYSQEHIDSNSQQTTPMKYTSTSGVQYEADAVLNIPSLGINYPVLSNTSVELLKISLNKYWGPNPNEVGNYCIVGHNYRNNKFFGNLHKINNGDIVELTDAKGRTIQYAVYDQYIVNPDETACTSQLTNGNREITLITCANYGKQRLIVKCREVS